MKTSEHPSTTGLKALAILGVAGFFVLPLVIGLVGYFVLSKRTLTDLSSMRGPEPSTGFAALGALGGACGGSGHLPCNPGSFCKLSGTGPEAEGVCVEAPAQKAASYVGAGVACDEVQGTVCQPTLYCRSAKDGKTCQAKGKDAPHILSVRFDGLQPQEDGTSLATAGQPVGVRVEAVNSVKAHLVLMPDGGKAVTKDMSATAPGAYVASMALPKAFVGRLIVLVEDKAGDTNSLVKQVAIGK